MWKSFVPLGTAALIAAAAAAPASAQTFVEDGVRYKLVACYDADGDRVPCDTNNYRIRGDTNVFIGQDDEE